MATRDAANDAWRSMWAILESRLFQLLAATTVVLCVLVTFWLVVLLTVGGVVGLVYLASFRHPELAKDHVEPVSTTTHRGYTTRIEGML